MRLLTCALLLTVSLAGARGASAQVFPGTGTGAIPDGGVPPTCGAPRVVSFTVTGATGNLMTVGVDFTLTHPFVSDLDIVLVAPSGAPSMPVVSRIGVTTATSNDSSNFDGTYSFSDGAIGPNIWTVATAPACGAGCIVTPGLYRTTAPGGVGQTNPPPVTSLRATFGGINATDTNGIWTLLFRDCAAADTGTVTAANLYIPDPLTDLIFIDGFEA